MVSKWWTRSRAGFASNQSKIYAISNRSDFSLIFHDVSVLQTLAIYRRLIVTTNY